MPNQKTWASEEEKIRAFQAKEEALKLLGYMQIDGLWMSLADVDKGPITFEKACERENI